MTEKQENIKDRIQFLVKEIERHRYLYYNETPEISDAKYDALEDELRALDPENPILFKIGVDRSELFTKREHIIPMSSQDKVITPLEFKKWAKKRNYTLFIIQFLIKLSFCITGALETFKNRAEAQQFIQDHGGIAKSGVSKTLSYLVTNSTEPTAKYVKAQELGVKIITEAELRAMINE